MSLCCELSHAVLGFGVLRGEVSRFIGVNIKGDDIAL